MYDPSIKPSQANPWNLGPWRAELSSFKEFDRRYAYGPTAFTAILACIATFSNPHWPETEHARAKASRKARDAKATFTGSGLDLLKELKLG